MDIARFKKLPLMGILRDIELEAIEPLMDTLVCASLETIEIAMNSKDAPKLIEKAVRRCSKKLMIGAGTVLNIDILNAALDCGATFIVSPVFIREVAVSCTKRNIPFFPGALTPKEIYEAWQAGATMVKVFPVRFFGPSYLKEIKEPLNEMRLLACGGVSRDNIKDYLLGGADAVAFGASIFRKGRLAKKDLEDIQISVKDLVDNVKDIIRSPQIAIRNEEVLL